MKIRTHYSSIERVVYEFSESDIEDALKKKAGIVYKPGVRVVFDYETGDDEKGYKLTATLTEIFETPQGDEDED